MAIVNGTKDPIRRDFLGSDQRQRIEWLRKPGVAHTATVKTATFALRRTSLRNHTLEYEILASLAVIDEDLLKVGVLLAPSGGSGRFLASNGRTNIRNAVARAARY